MKQLLLAALALLCVSAGQRADIIFQFDVPLEEGGSVELELPALSEAPRQVVFIGCVFSDGCGETYLPGLFYNTGTPIDLIMRVYVVRFTHPLSLMQFTSSRTYELIRSQDGRSGGRFHFRVFL